MEADYGLTQQAMEEHNRYRGDENLYVMFYMGAVQDKEQSLAEGRPIYVDAEYVKIIVPGDKSNIVDRVARPQDKQRFARQYEAFKQNKQEVISGTPLDKWNYLSIAQVEELKYFGVRTVEQLANVNDSTAQNFAGFQNLKRKAKEYLEATAADAPIAQLQEELASRDELIEQQAELIENMSKRLDALEADDED